MESNGLSNDFSCMEDLYGNYVEPEMPLSYGYAGYNSVDITAPEFSGMGVQLPTYGKPDESIMHSEAYEQAASPTIDGGSNRYHQDMVSQPYSYDVFTEPGKPGDWGPRDNSAQTSIGEHPGNISQLQAAAAGGITSQCDDTHGIHDMIGTSDLPATVDSSCPRQLGPTPGIVPQKNYTGRSEKAQFERTWNVTMPTPVNLADALRISFLNMMSNLEGWKQPAFNPVPKQKLSIRMEWECYDPWSKQQNVTRTEGGTVYSVNIAKLAHEIAKAVDAFVTKHAQMLSDSLWRVGPGAIELRHLYLVEVTHVAVGSIQPVLEYRPY